MTPLPRPDPRDPVQLLATGLGAGLAHRAPGTFGTLVGVAVYLAIAGQPLAVYLGITLLVVVAGVPICGVAARRMAVHDHPAIVWDEIAGFLLTMTAVPTGWPWVLAGFVLFRVFDIAKPWPVRVADRRVGGGIGIMLDDLLAAGYAWLLLQSAVWLSSRL